MSRKSVQFLAIAAIILSTGCDKNPVAYQPTAQSGVPIDTGLGVRQRVWVEAEKWAAAGYPALRDLLTAQDMASARLIDSLQANPPSTSRKRAASLSMTIAGPTLNAAALVPEAYGFSVVPTAGGQQGMVVASATLYGSSLQGTGSFHTVAPFAGGSITGNQSFAINASSARVLECIVGLAVSSTPSSYYCDPMENVSSVAMPDIFYNCGVTLYASGNATPWIVPGPIVAALNAAVPNGAWSAVISFGSASTAWAGQMVTAAQTSTNNGTCTPPTSSIDIDGSEIKNGAEVLYVENVSQTRRVNFSNGGHAGTAPVDSVVWYVDGSRLGKNDDFGSISKSGLGFGTHNVTSTVWDKARKSASTAKTFKITTLEEEDCLPATRKSRSATFSTGECGDGQGSSSSGGGSGQPDPGCVWARDYTAVLEDNGDGTYTIISFHWTSNWYQICDEPPPACEPPDCWETRTGRTIEQAAGVEVKLVTLGKLPSRRPVSVVRSPISGEIIVGVDSTSATAADLQQGLMAALLMKAKTPTKAGGLINTILGRSGDSLRGRNGPGSDADVALKKALKGSVESVYYFGKGRVSTVVVGAKGKVR